MGLGTVGCRIAKKFQTYKQYNIVCIDDQDSNWPDQMVVKKEKKSEDYENNFKTMPKKIKDKIKNDVILVLSGASAVCAISLKMLYQLRDKNITILCVRPETDLLEEKKAMQERMIFSVMQEYTRSGLFKDIFLTSNAKMDILIEDASIKEYYPAINELICSIFHMVMVFEHQDNVVGNLSEINEARRVCTLGILDMKSGEETLFFPMQDAMESRLYYGISKESLNNDKKLQRNIIELIKSKNTELCKYSYGVYETQYESDFCYVKSYSSKVQEF